MARNVAMSPKARPILPSLDKADVWRPLSGTNIVEGAAESCADVGEECGVDKGGPVVVTLECDVTEVEGNVEMEGNVEVEENVEVERDVTEVERDVDDWQVEI
jgi:hypothetical protein